MHSPDDSPDELIVSDSNSNITKAVVHVSYEPKQVNIETESTKKTIDGMIISKTKVLADTIDKAKSVSNNIVQKTKIVKEELTKNSNKTSCKTTNNFVKAEELILSPQWIR